MNLLKKVLAVIMAIPIGIAFTACSEQENGILDDAVKYTSNSWKSSQASFGNYTMQMPPFTEEVHDYYTVYSCLYNDTECKLYLFDLSVYVYTGNYQADKKTVSVIECDDALDRSKWFVSRSLGVELGNEDLKINYKSLEKINTERKCYSLEAVTDVPLYGYWLYENKTHSYLFLSDNQEMLSVITDTID